MIWANLEQLIRERFPSAEVVEIRRLGADAPAAGGTAKAVGYGEPLRVTLRDGGRLRDLVFHTARADEFGHDRRADRAAEMLLAYDTFALVPRHAQALDVGAVFPDGQLVSLASSGEFYLLTAWVPGTPYADDLRRIARDGAASPLDLERAEALAGYLAELHEPPVDRPAAYQRAIRDLVGHGEGIFGIIDGYGAGAPAAPPARLQAIERRCQAWRWRLRDRARRLRHTHGDFHPFNVVFEGSRFTLLDASRGCLGDPADDVICMAVNYVFFALEAPGSWERGLGALWRRFWRVYFDARADLELLEVVAPFLAWRGLVVCCPKFYPALDPAARDRMLGFVERALDASRFDPEWAEEMFQRAVQQ